MTTPTEHTAAEILFIEQYARTLLVNWCVYQLANPGIPYTILPAEQVYKDYAVAKGWISGKSGLVLANGFKVAATTLKR